MIVCVASHDCHHPEQYRCRPFQRQQPPRILDQPGSQSEPEHSCHQKPHTWDRYQSHKELHRFQSISSTSPAIHLLTRRFPTCAPWCNGTGRSSGRRGECNDATCERAAPRSRRTKEADLHDIQRIRLCARRYCSASHSFGQRENHPRSDPQAARGGCGALQGAGAFLPKPRACHPLKDRSSNHLRGRSDQSSADLLIARSGGQASPES
jgi:hypothetical protein